MFNDYIHNQIYAVYKIHRQWKLVDTKFIKAERKLDIKVITWKSQALRNVSCKYITQIPDEDLLVQLSLCWVRDFTWTEFKQLWQIAIWLVIFVAKEPSSCGPVSHLPLPQTFTACWLLRKVLFICINRCFCMHISNEVPSIFFVQTVHCLFRCV